MNKRHTLLSIISLGDDMSVHRSLNGGLVRCPWLETVCTVISFRFPCHCSNQSLSSCLRRLSCEAMHLLELEYRHRVPLGPSATRCTSLEWCRHLWNVSSHLSAENALHSCSIYMTRPWPSYIHNPKVILCYFSVLMFFLQPLT